MTQSFFISGVLPGLNELIAAAKKRRGNWSAYADMKESYGRYIQTVIRKAKLKPMPRAFIQLEWCEKNMKRDPDNVAAGKKFVNDALVNAGILPGDGWAHITGFSERFLLDKANPGVNVTLVEP